MPPFCPQPLSERFESVPYTLSTNDGSNVIRTWAYVTPFRVSMDCSMTAAGSFGVGSSGLEKQRVAGGRMMVAFGSPPDCSHVPVHWVAVLGPQPATMGRYPVPLPFHWAPVVVGIGVPLTVVVLVP